MSMLKGSMFVGFILLALIPVIHAACQHDMLNPGVTHCLDFVDKTRHEIGTTWRNSKCQRCSCRKKYTSCCDGWPVHVAGGCTIKYDYETCTYELIQEDENVPCSGVGK